jgi:proteasome lid subunit RPN8/RPN11
MSLQLKKLLVMIILITTDHFQSISHHAEQTYPEECCGLLLGIHEWVDGAKVNIVQDVYPTPNVWEQSLSNAEQSDGSMATAHRRYQIDPIAMLQAQQHARANAADIIGIYHSHPNATAIPSEWDRAWAWPQYSYLIVSLKNGVAKDFNSWSLNTDHEFLTEKLIVSGMTTSQVSFNTESTRSQQSDDSASFPADIF